MEVKHKKKVLAIVFRKRLKANGVKFLTPHTFTLQLGLIEHSKGKIVREHKHPTSIHYKVDTTQEFLYIEKGKIKISLYSDDWKLIKKVMLSSGDFILFVSGGHGLKVIDDCRIIEIKQGPYPGDKLAKIYR